MRLKQIKLTLGVVAATTVFSMTTQAHAARDIVQIAGSSTVLPFSSVIAEDFGSVFTQFKTPVVASGGSSGGMRQFCQGVGDNTIDIANSSRKIKSTEIEACGQAGVTKIQEIKLGYDGIVFASDAKKAGFKLKPHHMYAAIAEKLPSKGKLVKNPYTRWNQIDKNLPNVPITVVIPGTNHGTREVFEEKMVHVGCDAWDYNRDLSEDENKKVCSSFRKDGRVVEIAGDYTETLSRLSATPTAVGVFGLSFYDQNRDRLKVAKVNGVTPTEANIISGKYPVSRPLYFYVKGEHLASVKGLREFTEFAISEKASGKGSKAVRNGLIPLNAAERSKILADFKAGVTVK